MLEYLKHAARPLKAILRIVATNMLFLFVLHFSFYGKSPKEENTGEPLENPIEMQGIDSNNQDNIIIENDHDDL